VVNLISDLDLHLDRSADRFRDAGGLSDDQDPRRENRKRPETALVALRLGRGRTPGRWARQPRRFALSPINKPALAEFQVEPRGYWSLWIFLVLFFISLFAEFIANDKPLLIRSTARFYFPVFVTYPETAFGGDFETAADYRDPYLQKLIADKGGTMIWPLIRYSYDTHNLDLPTPAPSKPTWMLTEAECKDGGPDARA
jgi:microcin C transport system permease protein